MMTIENLPAEVLLLIFKFCEPLELKDLQLVCQRWLQLLRQPIFAQEHPLTLKLASVTDYSRALETFSKTRSRFSHVKLGAHAFWKNPAGNRLLRYIGAGTTHLSVGASVLDEPKFFRHFPVLKSLEVPQLGNKMWLPRTLESVFLPEIPHNPAEQFWRKLEKFPQLDVFVSRLTFCEMNVHSKCFELEPDLKEMIDTFRAIWIDLYPVNVQKSHRIKMNDVISIDQFFLRASETQLLK